MRWNDECNLIEVSTSGLDELLQPTQIIKKTLVACNKRDLNRSEFYYASQTDMRPSMILEVHEFEYDYQDYVEFEDKNYKIIKTFETGDIVELTCQEVVNDFGFS